MPAGAVCGSLGGTVAQQFDLPRAALVLRAAAGLLLIAMSLRVLLGWRVLEGGGASRRSCLGAAHAAAACAAFLGMGARPVARSSVDGRPVDWSIPCSCCSAVRRRGRGRHHDAAVRRRYAAGAVGRQPGRRPSPAVAPAARMHAAAGVMLPCCSACSAFLDRSTCVTLTMPAGMGLTNNRSHTVSRSVFEQPGSVPRPCRRLPRPANRIHAGARSAAGHRRNRPR